MDKTLGEKFLKLHESTAPFEIMTDGCDCCSPDIEPNIIIEATNPSGIRHTIHFTSTEWEEFINILLDCVEGDEDDEIKDFIHINKEQDAQNIEEDKEGECY